MRDRRLREAVRRQAGLGQSVSQIASMWSLPRSTVARWIRGSCVTDALPEARCWLCDAESPPETKAVAYAYLLGQYLGDGHLVTSARVPVLRIYACVDYPGIGDEIVSAIERVRQATPGRVSRASSDRLVSVQSYWMHWPCLFPQHGPGRKHERPIVLTHWQQTIADAHPWALIRGLIHSDGCRTTNTVVARGKAYSYPRYFFANESADILAIMAAALDRVGVAWRFNRPNSISIARRDAVALLETQVGPKC